MNDIDYIYKLSLDLVRKSQMGGLSSIAFQNYWNEAQSAYMDDLLGRFQRNNNSKEGEFNTGLIENETILTKLAPFIKPTTLTIAAGQSNKPSDFIYTLALRINNAKVFKVPYDEIWSMLDDVIDPPSVADDSYYYVEYQGYYKFFPNTVTSAELDYITQITNVVWGFTLDGDGRPVYDALTSVQPLWDSASSTEITKRMLKNIGVAFKDNDFAAAGQSAINTGD